MKITLLGTGTSQGVPIIGCTCKVCQSTNPKDRRLRTSAFFEVDDNEILIDSGPDLRTQLLNNHITDVDAILLTHEHKDHLAGLDDIRPIYFLRNRPMEIFGLQRVLNVVRKDFDYAFKANPYPGAPAFNLHHVRNDAFMVNDVEIIPIHVRHLTLPILGYRIQNAAYITDASFIAETEMQKLMGLDVLVINALRIKEHYSHFNLEQALNVIDILKPKRAYLTHMSHDIGLFVQASEMLPDNVFLGYDGLEINV